MQPAGEITSSSGWFGGEDRSREELHDSGSVQNHRGSRGQHHHRRDQHCDHRTARPEVKTHHHTTGIQLGFHKDCELKCPCGVPIPEANTHTHHTQIATDTDTHTPTRPFLILANQSQGKIVHFFPHLGLNFESFRVQVHSHQKSVMCAEFASEFSSGSFLFHFWIFLACPSPLRTRCYSQGRFASTSTPSRVTVTRSCGTLSRMRTSRTS